MTRQQQMERTVGVALSTYRKGCGFTLEQWFQAKELYRNHKEEMLAKLNFKPWTGFPS